MKTLLALVAALSLTTCQKDETISGQSGPEDLWGLTEMDGGPAGAAITLQFPKQGEISGQGPCNVYSAAQLAPMPWFEAGPIKSTKKACPDLAVETAYFSALSEMTLAERSGNMLLLTNDTQTLEFRLQ